jgi:hypothetical protein
MNIKEDGYVNLRDYLDFIEGIWRIFWAGIFLCMGGYDKNFGAGFF